MDTENKIEWYKAAERWEEHFCTSVAPVYGITARINVAKARDKTAPDLEVLYKSGVFRPVELKPQFTPFFMSTKLYNIHPQFAFSLNVCDVEEYKERQWWNLPILFWTDWKVREWNGVGVVNKVEWLAWQTVRELSEYIDQKKPPVHNYARRVNDDNNAKNSYILDITDFKKIERKNNGNH